MPRGSKPGERRGGRQKGTKNKSNAQREAEVQASGLTPLEFMLRLLRDETADMEKRMWAAQQAGPYVHPKLAQVEGEQKVKMKAKQTFQWLPPQP